MTPDKTAAALLGQLLKLLYCIFLYQVWQKANKPVIDCGKLEQLVAVTQGLYINAAGRVLKIRLDSGKTWEN